MWNKLSAAAAATVALGVYVLVLGMGLQYPVFGTFLVWTAGVVWGAAVWAVAYFFARSGDDDMITEALTAEQEQELQCAPGRHVFDRNRVCMFCSEREVVANAGPSPHAAAACKHVWTAGSDRCKLCQTTWNKYRGLV